MLKELKQMSGMTNDPRFQGYDIMRYWHPDAQKKPELVKHVDTLEEAQKHCQDPTTSNKSGPTSEWYFDGYVEAGSKSRYVTLW